jgi:hypothetical protein
MTNNVLRIDRTQPPRIKQRPRCVHCSKQYGIRASSTETIKFSGDKPPAYTGNQIVIKETKPYRSSIDGEMIMYRRLWDGKTYWLHYEPFCTLRCALDYARKAYRRSLEIR